MTRTALGLALVAALGLLAVPAAAQDDTFANEEDPFADEEDPFAEYEDQAQATENATATLAQDEDSDDEGNQSNTSGGSDGAQGSSANETPGLGAAGLLATGAGAALAAGRQDS